MTTQMKMMKVVIVMEKLESKRLVTKMQLNTLIMDIIIMPIIRNIKLNNLKSQMNKIIKDIVNL